jgi:hypothetical protein
VRLIGVLSVLFLASLGLISAASASHEGPDSTLAPVVRSGDIWLSPATDIQSASAPAPTATPADTSPRQFNIYDLVAGKVSIGMDSDTAIELSTETSKNYIDHNEKSGRHTERQEYPGVTLYFVENFAAPGLYLVSAVITGPEIAGPRGVRVGDSLESVLASFPRQRTAAPCFTVQLSLMWEVAK